MSLFSENSQQSNITSDSEDSDEHVLKAFRRRWEERGEIPFRRVVITGQEPFRRGKIWSYLSGLGAKVRNVGELSATELLVLGREGFDKDPIRNLLRNRRGKVLRICSQEMLLAWAMTGVDPNRDPDTAQTFISGHPGLSFVASMLKNRWPGTDALPSSAGAFQFDGPDKSPLKRLGYTTGKTNGLPRSKRRSLLRTAFELKRSELPGRYPEWYLQEWGAAKSQSRLKKLADKLSSNCRTFRRREDKDFEEAITHWENDLAWLKETFYNPFTYDFDWPRPE
jgi:hypothetical protein